MSSTSIYTTDHAESVRSTHRWRTVANSAAYILPYLRPDMKILDIGCGPGSITVDIAKRIPVGHITGIENESEVLEEGRRLSQRENQSNITFEVGDAHHLKYDDESFDMVHVHQVLQHIADPVKALAEMRRVVKPGGFVACRESAMPMWYPESRGLQQSTDLYVRMSRDRGGNPHPGSHIHVWAQQAGFERSNIICTTGSWCFASSEERAYWGGSNSARVENSGIVKKAVEGGYATKEQLAEVAAAWRAFAEDETAWYSILHGEMVCRK